MERAGLEVDPEDDLPHLEWEAELWDWYIQFQTCVLYRTETVPAGMGAVPVQKPYALDRSVWWPLIEREGWCHRITFYLIQRLEHALFHPIEEPRDE